MGSSVSPIICNLYVENFKQKVLTKAENPPQWWKRYVDDTYIALQKDQAQELFYYLHTIDKEWATEGEVVQEVVNKRLESKPE